MPDDTLYHIDIVTWSRQQAERLRRHAAGERVNGLDRGHAIEEIEGSGSSEVAAGSSLLPRAMIRALKITRRPESSTASHWRGESGTFLLQAQARSRPSVARSIPVGDLFRTARRLVLAQDGDVPP
ncbi:MAG: DUF29 domain-containing protein [Acetobacteraceae bacterium]|nr:DUF29 domain-containing protein [Acetobacteraceae bacterium]